MRFKRITVSIPDWGDDAHLSHGGEYTKDGFPKVVYYKDSKAFYIDIPKCKECKMVYLTPFKNKKTLLYNTNRVMIIDIYN